MAQTLTPQKIKSAQHADNSSSFLKEDETPRMVIDANNNIIFCNEALNQICDENIEGSHFNNIFTTSDNNIKEGINNFTVKKNNKDFSFQIDNMPLQNGEALMVASTQTIDPQPQEVSDQAPFIDLSFDACCITDNEGKFITINKNFNTLFGYNIEELTDFSFLDIIADQDKQRFEASIALLSQGNFNKHTTIETYCSDKQGTLRWIEWNHKCSDGKLYSTGRDLTPLKSYKDSLERQQKKLTEAEAIGHIGQWEWSVGSEKISFSDQLYRIFGVDSDTFNPTLQNITRMIDRRDSGRMMQVFQRAIIEQNDYDMDFRLTRPDGSVRYIHCEGRCETDQDDDVVALYGIMQDTTIATQRELDLTKAKESVEQAYAAKTQFLANMSHELRTPLNAIIGFSEMIERQLLGPIGTEKYLEYIGGIRESGEHLLDLISDILDMSKIEAGKYELNVEKFNISKVIRMAAHMMEGRAVDAGIKIISEIPDDNLNVVADRRAVMQMVLNILSNAVKFSHKNGRIKMILSQGKENIRIDIEDQGIGIPANKLANITMPFEQAETDYTREYEGSGLGLAITKELAEIHGGSLRIESQKDVGTKVTIRLPYKKETS